MGPLASVKEDRNLDLGMGQAINTIFLGKNSIKPYQTNVFRLRCQVLTQNHVFGYGRFICNARVSVGKTLLQGMWHEQAGASAFCAHGQMNWKNIVVATFDWTPISGIGRCSILGMSNTTLDGCCISVRDFWRQMPRELPKSSPASPASPGDEGTTLDLPMRLFNWLV